MRRTMRRIAPGCHATQRSTWRIAHTAQARCEVDAEAATAAANELSRTDRADEINPLESTFELIRLSNRALLDRLFLLPYVGKWLKRPPPAANVCMHILMRRLRRALPVGLGLRHGEPPPHPTPTPTP